MLLCLRRRTVPGIGKFRRTYHACIADLPTRLNFKPFRHRIRRWQLVCFQFLSERLRRDGCVNKRTQRSSFRLLGDKPHAGMDDFICINGHTRADHDLHWTDSSADGWTGLCAPFLHRTGNAIGAWPSVVRE